MKYRHSLNNVLHLLEAHQIEGKKILVDPYVPSKTKYGLIRESWGRTLDDLKPGNAEVLFLSRYYYCRFVVGEEVTEYVKINHKNWKDMKAFYMKFDGQSRVIDNYNQEWINVYNDEYGWQVWELDQSNK